MGNETSTPQQPDFKQTSSRFVSRQNSGRSPKSDFTEEKVKRSNQNQAGAQPGFTSGFNANQQKPIEEEIEETEQDETTKNFQSQGSQQRGQGAGGMPNQSQSFGQSQTQNGSINNMSRQDPNPNMNTSGISYQSNNKNSAHFGQNEYMGLQGVQNYNNNNNQQQYSDYGDNSQYQYSQQGYANPQQTNQQVQFNQNYQQGYFNQQQNNQQEYYNPNQAVYQLNSENSYQNQQMEMQQLQQLQQLQQQQQQLSEQYTQQYDENQQEHIQENSSYWDTLRNQPYDSKKIDIIEKLLHSDIEQYHASVSSMEKPKKISAQETQLLVDRLQYRGQVIQERNLITSNYYEQEGLKECTFQPNTSAKKSMSPTRTISDFLQKQDKFLESKEQNLQRIRTDNDNKERELCPHKPTILTSSAVVMISSNTQGKGQYASEPAYKRLFELNKRKKEAKQKLEKDEREQKEREKKSKKPKKASTQTIDRLYTLGKMKIQAKRQGKGDYLKSTQKGDTGDKHENENLFNISGQVPMTSKESEFQLALKLIKEYQSIVSIIVENAQSQSHLLDYIQMSEILRLMGFISFTEKVESHNFVKERSLVNDLWMVLQGAANGGVSYRNLLQFIFAVMGIDLELPRFKKFQDNTLGMEFSKDLAWPLMQDVQEVKQEEIQDEIEKVRQLRESRLSHANAMSQSHISSHYNSQKKIEEGEDHHEDHFEGASIHQSLTPAGSNQQYPQSQKKNKIDYNDMDENLKNWMEYRQNQVKMGQFDQENNIILSLAEIKETQMNFYLFYVNRLHTEKEKTQYFKNSPQKNRLLSSEKKLNKNQTVNSFLTEQLAMNYRNRVYEQAVIGNEKLQNLGDRVQHADILIAQKEEKIKYLELIKENYQENELMQCTFHPKTNNYVKPDHQTQSQQQDFFDPNGTNVQQARPNNNPMPPTSLGNKRYLDLYSLGKPHSQLRDKKTSEVEYEKNCDECTFNPDIGLSLFNLQKFRNSNKHVEVKNKDQAVDRLRKAWNETQTNQLKMSRGYYEFKTPNKVYSSMYSPQKRYNGQSIKYEMNYSQGSSFKRPYTGSKEIDTGLANLTLGNKRGDTDQGYSQSMGTNHNQQDDENMANQLIGGGEPYDEQYYENGDIYNEDPQVGSLPQFGNSENPDENQDENFEDQPKRAGNNDNQMFKEVNPLLYVDINLSSDKVERIVVYEGDQPEDLARQFIQTHNLDDNLLEKLTQMLQMQIEGSLNNQQNQGQ